MGNFITILMYLIMFGFIVIRPLFPVIARAIMPPLSSMVDYSGDELTKEQIERFVRSMHCTLTPGTRVLHVRDYEALTGGRIIMKLSLPASQLRALLKDSPYADIKLQSVVNYIREPNVDWIKPGTMKSLLSGELDVGGRVYDITIDTTDKDTFTVYLGDMD